MITVNHLSKSFRNPDGSVITVLKDPGRPFFPVCGWQIQESSHFL